jgi:PKD repeat protein
VRMASMRTWLWIAGAVVGASSLVFSACSSCEPEKKAPESAAPAATAANAPAPAGQPPAPAAAQPSPQELVVDELYVDAEADPDEGTPPLTVKFTSTVEDATGAITCDWDFGDGSPKGSEMNPTHVYQKVGDYVATLHCKDAKGIEGETEIDVSVYEEE